MAVRRGSRPLTRSLFSTRSRWKSRSSSAWVRCCLESFSATWITGWLIDWLILIDWFVDWFIVLLPFNVLQKVTAWWQDWNCIIRLHCSTAYVDAAYCCRLSIMVGWLWALQKRWTDRDAIQNVEYGHGLKMGISIPPQDGTILRRKGMAHCKV